MKYFGMLLFTLLLSGCAYFGSNSSSNPLTPTEQLCVELKRNIVFNTASGPILGAASATQRAKMYRLYDKYNCNKLERK